LEHWKVQIWGNVSDTIRIRITLKGRIRIRIRIKGKSKIRIRINVMRMRIRKTAKPYRIISISTFYSQKAVTGFLGKAINFLWDPDPFSILNSYIIFENLASFGPLEKVA
jgi:hypothetical protein